MSLIEIITAVISTFRDQKQVVKDLTEQHEKDVTTITEQANAIIALKKAHDDDEIDDQELEVATQKAKVAKEEAETKAAELEEKLQELETAGEELRQAILQNPELPNPDPDFNVPSSSVEASRPQRVGGPESEAI